MVKLTALLVYFFSLLVISSNQPTNIGPVDDWGTADRSYEQGHRRSGDRLDGHGQRKAPSLQRSHQHDPGHHAWGPRHDFHFQRKYEESYRGKTYFPHRIHRQGESDNPEMLSRRTIDVGAAEIIPQSLGNGIGTKRKRNLLKRQIKEDDKNGKMGNTAARNAAESEEDMVDVGKEMGRNRMIKMGPNKYSERNPSKRPSTGSSSSISHREPTRHKATVPKRNTTKNVDFVFPDQRPFEPQSTGCGESVTFCEDMADDYPREHIRQLLKKEGERFKEVFGRDSILEMNVTERIFKDETDLCLSNPRLVFPTKAKNKDDKWQFVINQDGYTQGIGVETCINPEKPCTMTDGFPQSYRSLCKQKYITRRLLSINESGGAGMSEFLFPSCCVCILQFVGPGTRSKTG